MGVYLESVLKWIFFYIIELFIQCNRCCCEHMTSIVNICVCFCVWYQIIRVQVQPGNNLESKGSIRKNKKGLLEP